MLGRGFAGYGGVGLWMLRGGGRCRLVYLGWRSFGIGNLVGSWTFGRLFGDGGGLLLWRGRRGLRLLEASSAPAEMILWLLVGWFEVWWGHHCLLCAWRYAISLLS